MSNRYDEVPEIEAPDPLAHDDVITSVNADSEVDFDDERESDQLPADEVAEIEAGTYLDDPEVLAEEEDAEED